MRTLWSKRVGWFIAGALLLAAVGVSFAQSNKAIDLARSVDYKGDLRACEQSNKIARTTNRRDAELERTAKLLVEALDVISKRRTDHPDSTNRRLRLIARKARRVQTSFKPEPLVNCKKEVLAP